MKSLFHLLKLFLLLVFAILCILAPNSAVADGAYSWKDSSGRLHFGSKPPKDAIEVKSLRGRTFSRYSSDRLLKPYKRMSLTAPAMEEKFEASGSKKSSVDQTIIAPLPELLPIEEENLIPSLDHGKVKVTHDDTSRVTSCEVALKNNNAVPIHGVVVVFEFEDGTLIPGLGPETIGERSEANYRIPENLLPISIQNVPGASMPPIPTVSVQSGHM